MILNLDFNSEKAIYLQLKEEIIKGIAKGNLKINESLPSVRAMSQELGINLHTVNKAYNLLKDEGYISIDRRKGAIINNLPLNSADEKITLIKEELELLVAKAYLSGVNKEEFINISKQIFLEYGVEKDE